MSFLKVGNFLKMSKLTNPPANFQDNFLFFFRSFHAPYKLIHDCHIVQTSPI